jgi:hypothetical protein
MLWRLIATPIIIALTVIAAPEVTAHRAGPNGLEGWLVRERVAGVESQGPLPTSLVIARNGKIIRRLSIQGGPFYWNFVFLAGGKQVAFEHGSLHFNLTCTLMDIDTAEHIRNYDCYQTPLSDTAPQWVKQLMAAPSP